MDNSENPTFSDSIVIARPPEAVYALVADMTQMGEWSPICTGIDWEGAERGVGAWFVGHNETPDRAWETRSQVVAAEPGKEFAYVVGGDRVRWGYAFEAVEEGTRMTESWEFLPAGRALFEERYGDDAAAQAAMRAESARTGIPETLAAVKKAAESL